MYFDFDLCKQNNVAVELLDDSKNMYFFQIGLICLVLDLMHIINFISNKLKIVQNLFLDQWRLLFLFLLYAPVLIATHISIYRFTM